MGLSIKSTSGGAAEGFILKKNSPSDRVIAIAGNPNVGKSTLFNALTNMNQHTGNWTGKTVESAQGYLKSGNNSYVLVDIPGTYSLLAHSAEEEIARNFICFGGVDATVVVCDATCLERNLNLVLQTMEICKNVIVCVNLMDEAKRKNIEIDTKKLSKLLGVPVVCTVARKKKTLKNLVAALDTVGTETAQADPPIIYPQEIEVAISSLEDILRDTVGDKINLRWLSLRLIDRDITLCEEIEKQLGIGIINNPKIVARLSEVWRALGHNQKQSVKDTIATSIIQKAEEICEQCVKKGQNRQLDRKIDAILTHKFLAFPFMLLLLAAVFYITISLANYPSALLSQLFSFVETKLFDFFIYLKVPQVINDLIVLGVFRVLSSVVAVMLPPMAIFFILFSLLEDLGYLPRVAFNLDKPFKKVGACGKQSLTMCMGFGCNAAGVVGCRIIDSPRERKLAILTNNFVPCNGRFPMMIAIISMFFVSSSGTLGFLYSSLILTAVILLGIILTFLSTKFLSKTFLKGEPSSFTLELPPYRRPQIFKTVIHSLFDRTLFVLLRSISAAAPAGLIIYALANIKIDGLSLLFHISEFLDPFAELLSVDGVIIMAFILGLPANEIVIPIMLMAYLSQGFLGDYSSTAALKEVLVSNGWTALTALNVLILSLLHFPCATTLLTIKKETGSFKYTLLAAVIPTVFGILICMFTTAVFSLL